MAGRCRGVQRRLQERENRKMNQQLHLVVMHAMSVEQAINDFLHVCGSLCKFFRNSTVALHCNGKKLKGLLEQRWTGYLATVTNVLNCYFYFYLPYLRYPPFTRKPIASLYFRLGVRTRLGVAISEVSGPPAYPFSMYNIAFPRNGHFRGS